MISFAWAAYQLDLCCFVFVILAALRLSRFVGLGDIIC